MSDTERELSEVLSAHADNTVGAISPQDARDAFVSLAPALGAVSVATPAPTTIVGAGTYALAAGTGGLSAVARGVDNPTGLRARYTGSASRLALVSACVVVSCASAVAVACRLGKNGTLTGMVASGSVSAGGKVTLALSLVAQLDPDDYIEPYITNMTDTTSIQVEAMNLTILGVIL